MSRGKKLLLLLGVLVVLAAAAVAVGRLSQEEEDTVPEDISETVFSVDADSVTALAWTYEDENLSFSRVNGSWTYDGDAVFPVDTSYLTAMLNALAEVRANKTIPDVDDLSQYGLAEPVCAVTVTADGEGTFPLLFGSETGMGGEVYCSVGDGNVYLVDSYIPGYFSYGLLDVAEKEELPLAGYVTGFRVDAEGETLTVEFEEDSEGGGAWRAEGGDEVLDGEKVNNFIILLTGLTGGQCASYNAGDEALEEYGLSSASAGKIVLFWTDEDDARQSVHLTIGAGIDGGSYAALDGSGMVYAVDAATFGDIIYTAWEDLLPDDGAAADETAPLNT